MQVVLIQNDGQIVLSGSGAASPYLFSMSNSPFSNDNIFSSLTFGTYYVAIKDSNGCQNLILFILVRNLSYQTRLLISINANIYWEIDSLVDGYTSVMKFNQAWQGPVS